MENWKQIYTTIEVKPEDAVVIETLRENIKDIEHLMYLRIARDCDPSFENILRLELFKDFLKCLEK